MGQERTFHSLMKVFQLFLPLSQGSEPENEMNMVAANETCGICSIDINGGACGHCPLWIENDTRKVALALSVGLSRFLFPAPKVNYFRRGMLK